LALLFPVLKSSQLAAVVASALHFRLWGFVCSGEGRLNLRIKFAEAGLVFMLAGAIAIPAKSFGQESVSETAKRKVKSRVQPEYPALARQLKVTGKVKLEVTISPDGHVISTRVIGGNPLLVNAAVDAVKKSRYEPAPKETTQMVEVEFAAQN
jgi:TonB family protein